MCPAKSYDSGHPSDIHGYSSQPQDHGVDPGLLTPSHETHPSYQPGKFDHPVYPTDSVGPERPGYGPYSGKPSDPGTPSKPGRPSSNFTAVVGAQAKVVERQSIDVLQKDHEDIFNILILVLESLQNRAETEDLSYYQLSGEIELFT